jgi:hypothetical protein
MLAEEMRRIEQVQPGLQSRMARNSASIVRSMHIVGVACQQICASRRRIFARLPISGGSAAREDDAPAESIRARIRSQLAAGDLPRIDGGAWAGISRGDRECACCQQPIPSAVPQYEPRDHPHLFAHLRCFVLWRELSSDGGRPAGRSTRA